jgi:hypothetical protein
MKRGNRLLAKLLPGLLVALFAIFVGLMILQVAQ